MVSGLISLRTLIIKLSALLRRLLRSHEHFVSLREELEAIDEYLDIEAVRFGPKLTIEKSIDPASLDVVLPSMLLQPLVENSIKHGLAPKVGEGRILIRTQPETARMLITKLSGLLRRLMRSTDHFVTLREELESIDEYLDIEVVRFGPQLKVDKQIAPKTLDVIVPSMLLQPLVENSIKHGLARKVGGGLITIRTQVGEGHTLIEVVDDGLGMSEERLGLALGEGIGLSNVNERLRTIYGANYHLRLQSVPGQGTCASIEIPDLAIPERVTA